MSPQQAQPFAVLIAALLLVSYFAGYFVLRARCTRLTPTFVVVPTSTPYRADTLVTFYKPMFYAEGRLTGRTFTLTPWGVVWY
jgi:hypothetical protein